MMKIIFGIFLCAFLSSALALHAAVQQKDSMTYCIVLDADASGTISYENALNETKTYDFSLNNATSVDGKCYGVNKATTDSVVIEFYPNNVTPTPAAAPWKLQIVFEENLEQTNSAYRISDVNLTVVFYENVFNTTVDGATYVRDPEGELEWHGETNHGFKCSNAGLSLVNGSSLVFKDLKVVAFAILQSDTLPANQEYDNCKLDIRTSDVVPIVVGACLAGLVIIVLIAYLIGRARAKRQGYASV